MCHFTCVQFINWIIPGSRIVAFLGKSQVYINILHSLGINNVYCHKFRWKCHFPCSFGNKVCDQNFLFSSYYRWELLPNVVLILVLQLDRLVIFSYVKVISIEYFFSELSPHVICLLFYRFIGVLHIYLCICLYFRILVFNLWYWL